MRDLKTSRSMWIKAGLFIVIGVAASALILAQVPDWRVFVLLLMAIWAFCRAYFFVFYVIERYIDPTYRFSGLYSMLRYLFKK